MGCWAAQRVQGSVLRGQAGHAGGLRKGYVDGLHRLPRLNTLPWFCWTVVALLLALQVITEPSHTLHAATAVAANAAAPAPLAAGVAAALGLAGQDMQLLFPEV